jgi:hypothetical protein
MFNLYGLIGAVLGVAARVTWGYVMLNGGKAFDMKYLRAAVWGGILGMVTGGFVMPTLDEPDKWLPCLLAGFASGFAWTGAAQIGISSADSKASE